MQRLQSLFTLLAGTLVPAFGSGITMQVDGIPQAPVEWIQPSYSWKYLKGRTLPQPGWQNAPMETLVLWETGPGPFGYGTGSPGTVLNDMQGVYSTLYVRHTFELPAAGDRDWFLQLVVQFDDGFVAWLDGSEVARQNAPGSAGSEPGFTNVASGTHDAGAVRIFELGRASMLGPGAHTLALMGLNAAPNDNDFFLGATLRVVDRRSTAQYILVSSAPVQVMGTAALPGAARMTVNGQNVPLQASDGSYSFPFTPAPGMNRLNFRVFDSSGALLGFTNRHILHPQSTTLAGGPVATDTTWGPGGVIRVTNHLQIAATRKLTIQPGTVVLFEGEHSILATNAVVEVNGSGASKAFFLPATGVIRWGEIFSTGSQGQVSLKHACLASGRVTVTSNGVLLVEDCVLRDYVNGSVPIVLTHTAASARLVRCHVANYFEVLFKYGLAQIEESLFEYVHGDGIDYDGVPFGSYIRNCTLRYGNNTNIDAMDVGENADRTLVERCHVLGFTDKGVSIGEGSQGILVRNCLFDDAESGIAIKDSCTATVYNNTIVNCDYGLRLYEKNPGLGGGRGTNTYNNILWSNTTPISLANGSTIVVNHSLVEGALYPGTGNLNVDPLFRNAALRDYRLSADSPARGSGKEGANMGFLEPLGASWIDTDGDEMPDQWELLVGLNVYDPRDAVLDYDSDGMTNYEEYLAGTDPENPLSLLTLPAPEIRPEGMQIQFRALKNRQYVLESRPDFSSGPWTPAQTFSAEPIDRDVTYLLAPPLPAHRYYRLKLVPPAAP